MRPEAEKKLLAVLREAGVGTAPGRVGQRLPEDLFADDLLAAVKTINQHANDYKYNQAKLNKVTDHMGALQELRQVDDPDVKEMAETYLGWIGTIMVAVRTKVPIKETFETYLKKRARKKRREKVPFTVRRTKVLHSQRRLSDGELDVVDGAAENKVLFQGEAIIDGEQYEIDFGDGVRAMYRPSSEKNLFARRGEFELVLPDRPDAKSLNRALDLASRLDPETILVLKGNKPLALRIHRRHRAILYASDPAFLDAALDDERGWCELSVPAMSLLVFRHRMLTDFSIEPFEFVAQARRRKNAPVEEAP